MKRKLALMSLLGLAVVLFVWGARQQAVYVNTDMSSTDQSAYMSFAERMDRSNFRYTGGRNRMPLYPALMSLFYEQGMSDEEFFERGKNVGIVIGLVALTVAFFIFRRVSKLMDALTATLVAMFTVFAYKSPYFQTEVLFYAVNLVLFYLLLSLVRKPQLRTAALAGIAGGVGYLTKASVLPGLLLAALLVAARGAVNLRRHRGAGAPPIESPRSRFMLKHLYYASVLLGCFLFVISPYIFQSEARFGRYFYNVNSTFYMWYDSWEEVERGTRAHGDRRRWPDMPEDQIPSFRKYVREHSPGQIAERFTRGFLDLWNSVARSYGYAEFLLAYAIALGMIFAQNARLRPVLLCQAHPCVLLFIVGYFLGYTALYAWYTPIASGNRLILSLFLPAMLMIVWVLSYARNHDLGYHCFGRRISASSISPAVLLFLTAYVLTVFPYRISTMYGGR